MLWPVLCACNHPFLLQTPASNSPPAAHAPPCSQVLVLVLIATLASKVLLEGYGSLPKYCRRRGKRTLACFVAAFAIFPLPELFPGYYWLCHSLW